MYLAARSSSAIVRAMRLRSCSPGCDRSLAVNIVGCVAFGEIAGAISGFAGTVVRAESAATSGHSFDDAPNPQHLEPVKGAVVSLCSETCRARVSDTTGAFAFGRDWLPASTAARLIRNE
jgi:hypothetical protein